MPKRRHCSEPQASPLEGKSGPRVVKIRKTGNAAPLLCCCSCKTGVAWFDHHIPYDLDKQDSSNRLEILFTGAFNLYTGEAEIRSSRRLEAASKVAVVDLANIYCAGCKNQPLGWLIIGAQAHHPVIRAGQYILQLSNLLLWKEKEYTKAKNMAFNMP
ncbi:hypothetical protein CK203_080344 [Vitis vinifera]|uniref:Yippee domain-containing protein n=1 Tax=Vitis vinifera TaxID=29760 RepID=A0A438CNN5_VITVI|nr:hypothetical protein CK203_080344 [Vitis vinifera]